MSIRPTGRTRDHAGRYFLALPDAPTAELVQVYDSTGRYLQAIGRAGFGPGEYQRPDMVLAGPGDSVLIVDNQARRLSVLDSSLKFVRSIVLPGPIQAAAVLQDGTLAAVMPLDATTAAPAVVYLKANGTVIGGFGVGGHRCDAMTCWVRRGRALAADANGGLWVARQRFRYELEHFDAGGRRTKYFTPAADWFAPNDSVRGASASVPPPPSILAVMVDTGGRLWVFGRTANPHWVRGLGPTGRIENGHTSYPVIDPDKAYDAVIEVRDTTDGHLIASQRLPNTAFLVGLGTDRAARLRIDGNGWAFVDVLDPMVVR